MTLLRSPSAKWTPLSRTCTPTGGPCRMPWLPRQTQQPTPRSFSAHKLLSRITSSPSSTTSSPYSSSPRSSSISSSSTTTTSLPQSRTRLSAPVLPPPLLQCLPQLPCSPLWWVALARPHKRRPPCRSPRTTRGQVWSWSRSPPTRPLALRGLPRASGGGPSWGWALWGLRGPWNSGGARGSAGPPRRPRGCPTVRSGGAGVHSETRRIALLRGRGTRAANRTSTAVSSDARAKAQGVEKLVQDYRILQAVYTGWANLAGTKAVVGIECSPKIAITVSNCIPSSGSVYPMCIPAFKCVYRMCIPTFYSFALSAPVLRSLAALPQTR